MGSLNDYFPEFLYTKRLTLERFNHSEEHYKCLLCAMNSKTAHERIGDYGIRTPAQLDGINLPVRLRGPQFKDGVADDDCYYLVHLGPHNPSGELAGGISFCQRVAGDTILPPDPGWILLETQMGKGYATEAAGELLRWAREYVGIKDMVVLASETNHESNRVAEKLGFVLGGRVADLDQPGKWMNVLILPEMENIEITGGLSVTGANPSDTRPKR